MKHRKITQQKSILRTSFPNWAKGRSKQYQERGKNENTAYIQTTNQTTDKQT